jgi:DNA helicase-2/ATP-dependent DNA helicase PcrA
VNRRYEPQDLADGLAEHGGGGPPVALTAEQAKVVGSPVGSALVVAGAGSGKTFVMALRVVYLVANGLTRAPEILGLTFTRKAAAELNRRIRWMLSRLPQGAPWGPEDGWPTVTTYNAYAAGMVRNWGLSEGFDPDARVMAPARRWALAHQVVEAWDGDPEPRPAAATLTARLVDLADQCSDNQVSGEDFADGLRAIIGGLEGKPPGVNPETGRVKSALPALARSAAEHLRKQLWAGSLISDYTRLKAELKLMDFADQVAWAGRIAAAGGAGPAAERAAYKAVLLDEFQDTSTLQIKFLAALFGRSPVMAVGDPNQAIYGWRGASAGALAQFLAEFPGPAGPDGSPGRPLVLPLSVARRNDRAILAAAERVAGPLRAAAAQDLGRALGQERGLDLPELAPRPGAGPGQVEVAYLETEAEEAAHVAAYLRREWAEGGGAAGPPGARPGGGAQARTACVLVRLRAQIPAIAGALAQAGIPHRVLESGGLLDVPEVRDLVCALRASQDLDRGDAFMRLAASPRFGLGLRDLDALSRLGRRPASEGPSLPPLDALDALLAADAVPPAGAAAVGGAAAAADAVPPAGASAVTQGGGSDGLTSAGRQRLARLGRVLRQIRQASTSLTLPGLVLAAERALGLDIDLMAKAGAQGRAHVDQLVGQARNYCLSQGPGQGQSRSQASLAAFLDWLELEEERGGRLPLGQVEADPSAVQILTVHGAKGLEWDVVAVPGLSEGAFPGVPRDKAGERFASAWLSSSKTVAGSGGLPWNLRLDRADLPQLDLAGATDVVELAQVLDQFRAEAGQHFLAEQRRLAYVAMTRAKTHLLLTGSWFAADRAKARQPSVFLCELAQSAAGAPALVDPSGWAPDPSQPPAEGDSPAARPSQAAPEAGRGALPAVAAAAVAGSLPAAPAAGRTAGGAAPPPWPPRSGASPAAAGVAPDAAPAAAGPPRSGASPAAAGVAPDAAPAAVWPPLDPLGERGPILLAAAARVEAAAAKLLGPAPAGAPAPPKLVPAQALELLATIDDPLAEEAWLLIAEGLRPAAAAQVRLGEQTSATGLAALAQAGAEAALALRLRRPIPAAPSGAAAVGTLFHEQVALELAHQSGAGGRQGLLDEDEVPFGPPAQDDALRSRVEKLMAKWRDSVWSLGRYSVVELEAPVETGFMGHAVSARIDAVFQDAEGRLIVVDWKTRRHKGDAADASYAAQAQFYQAALARSRGLDPREVKAYVHYVPENRPLEVTYDGDFMADLERRLAAGR